MTLSPLLIWYRYIEDGPYIDVHFSPMLLRHNGATLSP